MSPEIDEGKEYIGYRDALALVLANALPVGVETLGVDSCVGMVAAEDVVALVNTPTHNMSLKDGFAVRSEDVALASPDQPVRLRVIGSGFAGHRYEGTVTPGTAVRILSGSPLPQGADSIISGEFCDEVATEVYVKADAGKERNIFPAGGDVKAGTVIAEKGQALLPARLGLIAAGGVDRVKVYKRPDAALLGIGDEVVAPGQKLSDGQLYASNLVNVSAWLSAFGISNHMALAGDSGEAIQQELLRCFSRADVIMTSGGAWGSERDLVVGVLDELGWRILFHHVRIGPGKGIVFGLWQNKPVFCLPGGPPSNQMAFLQLALPGVLKMAGHIGTALPTATATLTEDIRRRHPAWTEFRSGKLARNSDGDYAVTPYSETSRLKSMAETTCFICLPEGIESLKKGQRVTVQMVVPCNNLSF
ncbi:MAG: molybdopterin molybdotransferase MoeA [Dehalococcoidia bacterium]|nr:molybdopterin molybdotransferase MoeA [Dehalococcoidia bacterium]